MSKFSWDQLLMRGKDLLLLGGVLWALLSVGAKVYNLPQTVEAQSSMIRAVQQSDIKQNLELQELKQGQIYLVKNTDEIKESNKAIWRFLNDRTPR